MVSALLNRAICHIIIQIIFACVNILPPKKKQRNVCTLTLKYHCFIRNDTYRVFTLSVHKTSSTFYVNITIADNATIMNADNKPVKTWIQREKGKSEVSSDDLYKAKICIKLYRFSSILCITRKVLIMSDLRMLPIFNMLNNNNNNSISSTCPNCIHQFHQDPTLSFSHT